MHQECISRLIVYWKPILHFQNSLRQLSETLLRIISNNKKNLKIILKKIEYPEHDSVKLGQLINICNISVFLTQPLPPFLLIPFSFFKTIFYVFSGLIRDLWHICKLKKRNKKTLKQRGQKHWAEKLKELQMPRRRRKLRMLCLFFKVCTLHLCLIQPSYLPHPLTPIHLLQGQIGDRYALKAIMMKLKLYSYSLYSQEKHSAFQSLCAIVCLWIFKDVIKIEKDMRKRKNEPH